MAIRGLTRIYRSIDLVSLDKATDIHDSSFDNPSHPIAVNGALNKNITPATYTQFTDMINATQLARFGLHNGE